MSIFKAYDIRGMVPGELDEALAKNIGKAIVTFLQCKQIVLGRDMRLSGKDLFYALAEGIVESGCDVLDIGIASTPMLYFACDSLKAEGSVMITASHNPPDYNGFKLTRQEAQPISGDTGIKEIEEICNSGKFEKIAEKRGKVITQEVWKEYGDHVFTFLNLDSIKKILAGKKIVVDAGNGMGALESEMILRKLPCTLVELFCKLDGRFPNHEADPLKEENTKILRETVVKEKADLGICFDGDADRVFFVDELGNTIPADFITCMLAEALLRKNAGEKILYDLRSSWIVKDIIKANNGKGELTKVGHAFIKEHMRRVNGAFGGELSGHFYFRENFFTDSGIIAALKVIELVCVRDAPLSTLIEPLKKYFQSGEINIEVKDKAGVLEKIKTEFGDGEISEVDGVRVDYDDWWFSVRASNTENLLRVNVEAKNKMLMEEKRNALIKNIS